MSLNYPMFSIIPHLSILSFSLSVLCFCAYTALKSPEQLGALIQTKLGGLPFGAYS